ncbi:hypothetical protein ACFL2V_00415, partial [Pseudomonadota bacterium]
DGRRKLTWRNRFADVPDRTDLHNFYSSGEEVLEHTDGSAVTTGLSVALSGGAGAWYVQERTKGTRALAGILAPGFIEGGWGFNCKNPDTWLPSILCDETDDLAPATAFADWPNERLREASFFRPFSVEDVYEDDGSDGLFDSSASLAALNHQDHLLGFSIPALSHATGSSKLNMLGIENIDMQLTHQHGWPLERGTTAGSADWRHSDAKDVAYRYVYKLYDDFVDKGVLK